MKCRICSSTEHLMARCPNKGGGSSSRSAPSFAGLTDTSQTYAVDSVPKRVRFKDDLPMEPPSYPTRASTRPVPPWESDEQVVMEPPPGYLVLPGYAAKGDSAFTHQVYMNLGGQDPLASADPWREWSPGQVPPPPPPFSVNPTITQRVVGAVAAVGSALRGRSQSPTPRASQQACPAQDPEAGLYHGPGPWWSNFQGPAAAHAQPVVYQHGCQPMYVPATAQPPPYRPGWSTPPE